MTGFWKNHDPLIWVLWVLVFLFMSVGYYFNLYVLVLIGALMGVCIYLMERDDRNDGDNNHFYK